VANCSIYGLLAFLIPLHLINSEEIHFFRWWHKTESYV